MDALIDVRGLRFRYDDGTVALDGVDFQLYPGETVAIFGANGSGKTTFVLHLNGLLMGSGAITICGKAVNRQNLSQVREKVGVVFQDSEMQLFMPTVLEDVAFGPLNRTMARPPRPGADERATIVSWMSAIMRVVRQRLLDSGKRAEFSGIIQRARNEKSCGPGNDESSGGRRGT